MIFWIQTLKVNNDLLFCSSNKLPKQTHSLFSSVLWSWQWQCFCFLFLFFMCIENFNERNTGTVVWWRLRCCRRRNTLTVEVFILLKQVKTFNKKKEKRKITLPALENCSKLIGVLVVDPDRSSVLLRRRQIFFLVDKAWQSFSKTLKKYLIGVF